MAIPTHYIKKRDLLHSEKTSREMLMKTGREFLALERFSDALDFFEKAKDSSALSEIKQVAIKNGDTFLLSRLDRYDRTMVSLQDWETVRNKAEVDGRPSMAEFAQRKITPPETTAAAEKPVLLPGAAPLDDAI